MKYQALTKWDKNRPEFLKLGFILAIGFVLMAFNYTTYPSHTVLYQTVSLWDEVDHEIIPPRTPPQQKAVLPPPSPKIELTVEIEPKDEPTFVETKHEVVFDESNASSDLDKEEYASPTREDAPAAVVPIIPKEEPKEKGPMLMAERMPVYEDCNLADDESVRRSCTSQSVMRIINSTVKYPALARENEIEGTVVVSFVVTKSGTIENIEILRDIGAGCGASVLKAMKRLGKFYPGKHNGRPVAVVYRLPVKFQLR